MSDFEPDLSKTKINDFEEFYSDKRTNTKIQELEDIIKEKDIQINYLKGQIEDLEEVIKRGSFKTADSKDDLSLDEIGLFNIMQNQTYILKRLL